MLFFLKCISFIFVKNNFLKVFNQKIALAIADVTLYIKREDMIHPYVSGNKFRKLKYNLLQAREENQTTLLTFGGAFSNHILAVAAAGKENNFKTIGVIRGEELSLKIDENPTLKKSKEFGMEFEFVTREDYRNKHEAFFIEKLHHKFGSFYLLPEGGTNPLAVKGCKEILVDTDEVFDYICCPVGTGGTISGIINSAFNHQKVLGFPALKGDFLKEDIRKFAHRDNWELINDYHFDGYGKVNEELIQFINCFKLKSDILLDPIYTGKMVFGVIDMIQKKYFPNGSKILLIHTGGLQGVKGMNMILKNKKLTLIDTND
jgi:1-aminocyclopropane-1-carboxylate deaminase